MSDWDSVPATTTAAAVSVSDLPDIKLFGRWSADGVEIGDMSLAVSSKLHFHLKFALNELFL